MVFFFFSFTFISSLYFKFARSREHSNDFKQRVAQEKTVFAMDTCAADQCQSDRPPHYVHNVITEKGKGGGFEICSFHSPKIDVLATNRIRWLAVQHSRELKASPQPACTSSLVSKNAQSKINCTCMVRKRKAVEKLQLYPPFLAFLNYLYETTWNTCESAPSQKGRRVRPVAARDRVTFLQCTQRDILGSDQCVIFFSYNTVSGKYIYRNTVF